MRKKNQFLTMIALLAVSVTAFAQQGGNGANAIGAAASEISGYSSVVQQLMFAIGGIVGIVGAIRAYIKWNNGDQDVQKTLVSWFGACIFLVLAGTVVTAFFP